MAAVTKLVAAQGLNIDGIRRLTGRVPLERHQDNVRACIEFSLRGTPADLPANASRLAPPQRELGNGLLVPTRQCLPPNAETHLL